jgi:hypothetical protein
MNSSHPFYPLVWAQEHGPGTAAISVAGPWLALAAFCASSTALDGSWRLGPGSADAFAQVKAVPPAGPGLGRLFFHSRCPMGAPIGSLFALSKAHPALDFFMGCEDDDGEPQGFLASSARLDCITEQEALEAFERLRLPGRAQADLEARRWLEGCGSAPALECWGPLAPWKPYGCPWLLLESAKLLANDPSADPGAWARWPEDSKEFWTLAATPWTARPFWSSAEFSSRHLPAMAGRGDIERPWRQAALRRFADAMGKWGLQEPLQAEACVARALIDLPLAGAGAGMWRSAALAAPLGFGPVLARGMARSGVDLRLLFDAEELAAAAQDKPQLAAALMREAPWSAKAPSLQWLAQACPEPAASAALAKLLEMSAPCAPETSDKSGRTRL